MEPYTAPDATDRLMDAVSMYQQNAYDSFVSIGGGSSPTPARARAHLGRARRPQRLIIPPDFTREPQK